MVSICDVAKTTFFDTDHWRSFFDVSLTLRQARKSDNGRWARNRRAPVSPSIPSFYETSEPSGVWNCREQGRQTIRVIPILEKTIGGRWHYHCAIEPPAHADGTVMDAVNFESLIHDCWGKVHWGYKRVLVRDNSDRGWINYLLKRKQKSALKSWFDCIDWELIT